MISFINTFIVTGDRDKFERLATEHEHYLRTQPGFGGYQIARSLNRKNEYVNIVQWNDSESHQRLMETETFQAQVGEMMEVIDVVCTEMALQTEAIT